jgi:glycosyltransferase involved in cell wall biosynthesis
MQVIISQPVIPHYRVPLFAGLAVQPDIKLQVLASPEFPHSPRSVSALPDWAHTSHRCLSLADQLFWQSGFQLPPGCGPGDVLVVPGNPRILSNLRLLWQARRLGMGVVWWGHWWSPTSVRWQAKLREWLARRADVVLVYTEEERRMIQQRGEPGAHIMAAGNALSTDEVDRQLQRWDQPAITRFREQAAIGERLLLFCGRLRARPPTELHLALHALRELRTFDASYGLAVIGSGDDGERLRRIAAELGVADGVRWLGELYDEAALAPWFLSARCLVYPGAIGLTVLHAFAYGLPVVTHADRRLHSPEFSALTDGRNGLLFAPGDTADLCAKVRLVCEQPELRAQLSAGAFRTVRTDYSISAMIERCHAAVGVASRISRDRCAARSPS